MKRWWMLAAVGLAGCGSDSNTTADAAGTTPGDGGTDSAHPEPDATAGDGSTGGSCAAAAEQLLGPIDLVSTGIVTALGGTPSRRTLYIDASAGGTAAASTNSRIYVNLETGTKVDVTDRSASSSRAWDLAIKRPVLFTNSGDGGSGQGGSLFLGGMDFDAVSPADAAGKSFPAESFFETDCAPKLDATGVVRTSFDGWYEYDSATNALSPADGTWLVKGGTGKVYKVRILSYYATPDGGVGQAGGRYTMEVGAL